MVKQLSVSLICPRLQVKPDGVQRGLVGEIISRFERKGFTLKGLKLFVPSKELAEEHYKDLKSKPFFNDLVSYIVSGPVVAIVSSSIPDCRIDTFYRGHLSTFKHSDLLESSRRRRTIETYCNSGLGRRWGRRISPQAHWSHKSPQR